MNGKLRVLGGFLPLMLVLGAAAQDREARRPEPSFTLKGTLQLPVAVGAPLFEALTEGIGGIDGCVQQPLWKGLGVGAGARAIWFGLEERAFAPLAVSGDVFRTTWFGKVQWERYTGRRTFTELAFKAGVSDYRYTTTTAGEEHRVKATGLHWGGQFSLYLHASDDLAFGLQLGYEQDQQVLDASRFGLAALPGRTVRSEGPPLGFLTVGLGFSTRFRRSNER